MSRCFPFPSPGYERKIKADDPDLVKKEKHREKKQKREKKESNEKYEKESTDEKRGEKRAKREEDRDKREKDRDKKEMERGLGKDKHKENGFFPDEKRTVRPPDVHLHNLHERSKVREHGGSIDLGGERVAGPSVFNNGGPVSKNNHHVSQTKIFKNAQGLGKTNTDEERRISNQLPDKIVSAEKKKDGVVKISGTGSTVPYVDGIGKAKNKEKPAGMGLVNVTGESKFRENALGQNAVGPGKLLGKSAGTLVDGRERKENKAINGRIDGWAAAGEVRHSSVVRPPNLVGIVQNGVGAMARPVEKEKVRKEEDDNRKREKRKEDGREKTFFKDKDTKKEEKVTAISKQKNVHMSRNRNSNENHMLTPNAKDEMKMDSSVLQSDKNQSMTKPISKSGTILGKRKDVEINGIHDEHMTMPNKLARATDSTLPLGKNGRNLEPCQNSAAFAARPPMNIKLERTFAPDDTQRPPMNTNIDSKAPKLNGTHTSPLMQSSQKPTKTKTKTKSDVSVKPPHPDTKYLSQILSVPKLDEWPESDDQEWLFSNNSSQTRKFQTNTSGVDDEEKVWARALWLEPVDVFALPYVIPH